jgi:regulator of sirC expression with transglutaminase-like and TPR domain
MSRDPVRAANRASFAELVARPEAEIDLARGALLIAAAGRPHLDPRPTLDELDRLAERVDVRDPSPKARAARAGSVAGRDGDGHGGRLQALHDVLYDELGFRGPSGAGSDAGHSLLDVVLARRVGLPISLAVVEMEVARRAGLALHGVALPGHFVVGGPNGLLIDPADGGRTLTRDDCQALIRRATGKAILLRAAMLRPAGARAILARMLRNLRVARLVGRDWPGALAAIELLEVLEPDDAGHARDRGLLLGRMGRFSDAVALLGAYVELRAGAEDSADVRQAMEIFAARRN